MRQWLHIEGCMIETIASPQVSVSHYSCLLEGNCIWTPLPGSCIGHMLHHLCSPPKQAITQIKFKPRIKAFALVCAKNYVFFSVYKNLLFLFYLLPFQNTLHYIIYFTLYFNKCQFYLIFNCFFVFCTQPPPSTLFTGVGEPKPISKGGEAKYNKIIKKKRKKRKKKKGNPWPKPNTLHFTIHSAKPFTFAWPN